MHQRCDGSVRHYMSASTPLIRRRHYVASDNRFMNNFKRFNAAATTMRDTIQPLFPVTPIHVSSRLYRVGKIILLKNQNQFTIVASTINGELKCYNKPMNKPQRNQHQRRNQNTSPRFEKAPSEPISFLPTRKMVRRDTTSNCRVPTKVKGRQNSNILKTSTRETQKRLPKSQQTRQNVAMSWTRHFNSKPS